MIDLVVTGGKIATASFVFDGDIAVKDGLIYAIGSHGFVQNASKFVNAEGKVVIPGGVDPHVHFRSKAYGTSPSEDFESGSTAASCGGVSTVIDFAKSDETVSPIDAVKEMESLALGKTVIDYSLHCILTKGSQKYLQTLKQMIDPGVPSSTLFMTYGKDGTHIDDGFLLDIFGELAKYGGLPDVHAENDAILVRLTDQFLKQGKNTLNYHALTRPSIVEAEAVNRAIFLAKFSKVPIYFHHISTALSIAQISKARSEAQPVYGEVCTHHLTLTDELYDNNEENVKYIMTPPLRTKDDITALWNAVLNGTISTIASDHSPWNSTQKAGGKKMLGEGPYGVAGVETRIPIVFSEGVMKRGMDLRTFVRSVSTNAARIFGMYPRKGEFLI